MSAAHPVSPPRPHQRSLPLRVGTRGSPLALAQTRAFLAALRQFCPVLRQMDVFEEYPIRTTGDAVQDRRLAEIGGKGLFAKEIHEALAEGRVDFAVHSLKDLETTLPDGVALACTLAREDARDALILPAAVQADPADPFAALPEGAVVGTSSVRRAAQLLHARPDLRIATLRGNVQTRLDKLASGACDATLLALAGLRRLDMEHAASVVLDPEMMVPAAGQGIVGITVREADLALREMLAGIEDRRGPRCRHRRARAAGRAGRVVPHADRRPCAAAAERKAAADRAGGARGRLVPVQAQPGGSSRGRGGDRRRAGPRAPPRIAGRYLRLSGGMAPVPGRAVLVTRPEAEARETAERLERLGWRPVLAPAIRIAHRPLRLRRRNGARRRFW